MVLSRRQGETQCAFGLPLAVGPLDGTGARQLALAGTFGNRAGAAAPGDEGEPNVQGDAIGERDTARAGDAVLRRGRMVVLMVDLSRQNGIHDCVPHNWSAGSPKSARPGRTQVSPQWWRIASGETEPIVTGRTIRGPRAASSNRGASSSVVTVTVTSEKLVVSVGENAEEAGVAGDSCWCCDHHCLAPFVYRRVPP